MLRLPQFLCYQRRNRAYVLFVKLEDILAPRRRGSTLQRQSPAQREPPFTHLIEGPPICWIIGCIQNLWLPFRFEIEAQDRPALRGQIQACG